MGFLNRRLSRWTDAFIGVAPPHARHLIDVERFPASKVYVIPNGVDTVRFRPAPDRRRLIRQQFEIPPEAPVVGIVAALRPEKNHELFLRAAALVVPQWPAVRFLIVGDGPERPRLEQAAAALGLRETVRFLGTRPDVPDLLAAMDVLALTSDNEANPVSILEALACGVPVVATRVGSVPESVVSGETGYLVNRGDANQVAARIQELIADPILREKLGRLGRDRAVRLWSVDRMVRGYEDLLVRLYREKCTPPWPQALVEQPGVPQWDGAGH